MTTEREQQKALIEHLVIDASMLASREMYSVSVDCEAAVKAIQSLHESEDLLSAKLKIALKALKELVNVDRPNYTAQEALDNIASLDKCQECGAPMPHDLKDCKR